eukprot:Clim_evm1s4 gene=Clim_evmTU1s4
MKSFILVGLSAIAGMAAASPAKCQQPESCTIATECCDNEPFLMTCVQSKEGNCVAYNLNGNPRRINDPCDDNSDCMSQWCQNGFFAPNLVNMNPPALDDGEDCLWDFSCKGGWCAPAPGDSGVCKDRALSDDPPKW